MTNARKMDLIVTGIDYYTKHDCGTGIVWYGFPVGDAGLKCWRIPQNSSFDLTQIKEGKRYHVWSENTGGWVMNRKKQQPEWNPNIKDWVKVEELSPKAKSTILNARESKAQKELQAAPIVDGGLFDWNPNNTNT